MTADPFTAWMSDAMSAVEATEKAATPGSWHVAYDYFGPCIQGVDGEDIADERGNDHHADAPVGRPISGADAAHIAAFAPATVLAMVEADRKLLALHKAFEIPKYEYTGNPTIKIDTNGREIRHWPPGSITGQRQVGASYRCEHCETREDNYRPYPCPTLRVIGSFWERLYPQGYDEAWRPA